MGHSASKNSKINENHNKQKMFRIGISAGINDLNLEGHVQVGYCSKTVKNYNPIEKTRRIVFKTLKNERILSFCV
jgi:hypothetical protein